MSAPEALVIVDVQRGLVEGPHAVPGVERVLPLWKETARRAKDAGAAVVYLQDEGIHDAAIRKGTPGWELAFEVVTGHHVSKTSDDGFAGTALETVLRTTGVETICLIGIQSEMCVAATARGALAGGFTVVLPRDGHVTYDIPAAGPGAPEVPAAHVSRVAEWALGDSIETPDSCVDVIFKATASASGGRHTNRADGSTVRMTSRLAREDEPA